MRNFIISTETACDLTEYQVKELNISVMPMNFYIDGDEYSSKDSSISNKDLCDKMKNGALTKTSQPNDAEIEEYLINLLSSGKDILHISFSSAMSGTAEHFKLIAEKLNETHENKIWVVDSLCMSAGVGLLLTDIIQKIDTENLSIEKAFNFAQTYKHGIVHYFVVEDLKYLARGGRISTSSAVIGNIIKLKPVLHLDTTGKIVALQKVLGRKKSISTLIDKFKNYYNEKSNNVYITHADAQEDAEYLKSKILDINPNVNISINTLGPVIVSHSGPGTLALFFTANERK